MNIKGLATGIGSLPFHDADQATDFVLKNLPQVPFWPQLPKRDLREGMVAQFSEGLPCIRATADGMFFDEREKDRELEVFYGRIIAGETQKFAISRDYAAGLYSFLRRLKDKGCAGIEAVKCQITGPFTVAASVNDKAGVALIHDEIFMEAVIKGLAMKALWQIRLFEEFKKPLIVFVDEPYLSCFGSAFTPLSRDTVIKNLTELTKDLQSDQVTVGVHCCGNTDWSIFTEVESIGLISFDAFEFWDRLVLYADDLKKFLKRGGILCWGMVPTQEYSDAITPDVLKKRLDEALAAMVRKGVDEKLVRQQLLVSPACGCGSLDVRTTEKIFGTLGRLSVALKG
ncbi:MAG: hypothetical protein PHT59_02410 [Candidatus Omnitrophica bacterium]|nr:hypothetical protein [Candidatus Omnitrophota bacterium]